MDAKAVLLYAALRNRLPHWIFGPLTTPGGCPGELMALFELALVHVSQELDQSFKVTFLIVVNTEVAAIG